MRLSLTLLFIGLASQLFAQEAATGNKLAQLQEKLTAQREKLQAPLRDWEGKYLVQLTKMEKESQLAGDLDLVVALRAEKEAFRNPTSTIPDTFTALKRARATFENGRTRIRRQSIQSEGRLLQGYRRALTVLQADLTREGLLDDAVSVRAEVSRMDDTLQALSRTAAELAPPPTAQPSAQAKNGWSKIVGRYPLVEGFAEGIDASSKDSYSNFRGRVQSYWAYANGNDQFIEWRTAEASRRDAIANKITFVWAGSNGEQEGDFDLLLNGKKILVVDVKVQEDRLWKRSNVELAFDFKEYRSNVGNSGIYYLTVPRNLVKVGEQQVLKLVEKTDGGGRYDWIMVHGFTDMLDWKPEDADE